MNQRIKELAEQAGVNLSPFQFSGTPIKYEVAESELTKFAELIVQECADVARDTDLEDVEGGDSEVLRAAKRQILEHFGVKE